MSLTRLGILVTALGTLVLAYLFLERRVVDPEQHQQFVVDLHRFQESDANLNRDVLQVRYGLLDNYDPLVAQIAQLRLLQGKLEELPDFIGGAGRRELNALLADQAGMLADKLSKAAFSLNSIRTSRTGNQVLFDIKAFFHLEGLIQKRL